MAFDIIHIFIAVLFVTRGRHLETSITWTRRARRAVNEYHKLPRQSRTVFISHPLAVVPPTMYGPTKTFEARYETPSSVARSRPLQLSGLPVLTPPPLPVMIITVGSVWYAAVLIDKPHHDRVYVLVRQHSVWRKPFLTPIPVGVFPRMRTLLILNVVVCVMVSCAPSDRRSGREEFSVTGTHGRGLIALMMRGTPICLWHSTTAAYPGNKSWQMSKGHQHPR